jgi:hypothetical protein
MGKTTPIQKRTKFMKNKICETVHKGRESFGNSNIPGC